MAKRHANYRLAATAGSSIHRWRDAATRIMVLTLVATLFLSAAPAVSAQAQAPSATVNEIVAGAGTYVGKDVAVVGDVDDILGARAFTIEDDNTLVTAEIPVVSARPILGPEGELLDLDPLNHDDPFMPSNVMVTGTVHQFNLAAFEQQLGLDLDDARWSEWAGKPAIIARSIMPWPRYLDREAATVDQIAEYPQVYCGKTATVRGEIEEILGPRALTIEDDDLLFDEQILVVSAAPMQDRAGRPLDAATADDRGLWVAGTVRSFVLADVEQELGVDLEDRLFGSWEGRPAIVAQSVRLAPR